MSRPRRIQFSGAFYHLCNRGVEKRPLFFNAIDRKFFLKTLADCVFEFDLELFAYCLMDNHYHLFLQISQPNLNYAIQKLQGTYAQKLNKHRERVGALFQSRYKSQLIDSERYALTLTRYIHRNPIEAQLVQELSDFSWSSYPSYTGTLPKWDWLNTAWILEQFHPDQKTAVDLFRVFHNITPPKEEPTAFERMRSLLL